MLMYPGRSLRLAGTLVFVAKGIFGNPAPAKIVIDRQLDNVRETRGLMRKSKRYSGSTDRRALAAPCPAASHTRTLLESPQCLQGL
jgi:hypothetical protein